jgi:hypothetical protein
VGWKCTLAAAGRERFFDLLLRARLSSKAERSHLVILRPHIQISLQECSAGDRNVVYLVGDTLEDGVACGEVVRRAEADLGDAARYGGRTEEARSPHAHG